MSLQRSVYPGSNKKNIGCVPGLSSLSSLWDRVGKALISPGEDLDVMIRPGRSFKGRTLLNEAFLVKFDTETENNVYWSTGFHISLNIFRFDTFICHTKL